MVHGVDESTVVVVPFVFYANVGNDEMMGGETQASMPLLLLCGVWFCAWPSSRGAFLLLYTFTGVDCLRISDFGPWLFFCLRTIAVTTKYD